jgi:murein DD-endopeptidase MepM/ murein hydrolase activator NlpD
MWMPGYKKAENLHPTGTAEQFGIRSPQQLFRDYATIAKDATKSERFQLSLSSLGHLRPTVSIPAYLGYLRKDGLSPIVNLFDRVGGGVDYSQRVSRDSIRDFRGGKLGYDEHDGIDFVCPPGTTLCAAAAGTVVYQRDNWLRGGLTIIVDHGSGLITQYTHCTRPLTRIGQRVFRGEPVAISGTAGVDMTTFFPLVPPHLHFSVWDCGRPIDPFLSDGEDRSHGVWRNRNQPIALEEPATEEPIPPLSEVDEDELSEAICNCQSDELREELQLALRRHGPSAAAGLLEDALHHDRYAWEDVDQYSVRPTAERNFHPVQLSLPFDASDIRGSFFCDGPMTRPPS